MNNQTRYSERLHSITLTLSTIICSTGLFFGGLLIFVVIINKRFHTIANLLTCNSSLCTMFYLIGILIQNVYGLLDDWLYYQPACVFRAYFQMMCCPLVTFSYLIQAISRLFFTVFYARKNLHTFRIHHFMIILNWCISIVVSCIGYLLDNHAAILVLNCRYCLVTPEAFKSSIFGIIVAFLIPYSLIIVIYTIIFIYVRQSKRRINPQSMSYTNNKTNIVSPN